MNLWGKFLHLSWILALSVTTVSICKHLEASDLLKPLLQPPDRTVQQHSRLQARMQQCRNSIWHSSFYPGVTATPSSLGVGESWSLTSHLWPCHSSPEPSGWLLLLNHIRCELVALLSGPTAVLIPFPRQQQIYSYPWSAPSAGICHWLTGGTTCFPFCFEGAAKTNRRADRYPPSNPP